jgi:Predicted nucleic-acid-binding protein, contains PIN domain
MPVNFYDTNILLYLASEDTPKADAAERALALGGTISVQVLNEFVHVARRKMNFSWQEIDEFLGAVTAVLTVIPLTIEIHDKGREIARRYGFSIYDAMIIAAALACDCDTPFSEDMSNGMRIDGLTVINPLV